LIKNPRYVHTNLICRDWRALAKFYTDLFVCEIVPPERNYAGAALEAGSGLRGAAMSGVLFPARFQARWNEAHFASLVLSQS
jgi:hypothetical protein